MLAARSSARNAVRCLGRRRRCFSSSGLRPVAPRLIERCPEPTCSCEPTPRLPPGTDPVDVDSQLLGTVALHNRLVVVDTGVDYSGETWPSKIENDGQGVGAEVIRATKSELGVKGGYFNPYWNAMVVASSFGATRSSGAGSTQESSAQADRDSKTTSALLFPQGIRVSGLKQANTSALIKQHILPSKAELASSLGRRSLPENELDKLPLRQDTSAASERETSSIDKIIVFICGHAQRDARCGVLGPVLQREFSRQLAAAGVHVSSDPTQGSTTRADKPHLAASVSLISHIGGHKFAGNVIIHIPKGFHSGCHALAGRTVWYGRVQPAHVEGIVRATLLEGKVIRELLRGGMDAAGEMLSVGDFDVAEG